MTIERAIASYLRGKPSITGLVGDDIYPEVAPDKAPYPFITYTIISESHDHAMSGATGLAQVTVQLDVWTSTFADRVSVSEAIRNALDGFRGSMGAENLEVRNCFFSSRSTSTERELEGKGQPIHRATLDFSIWHVESVPTL